MPWHACAGKEGRWRCSSNPFAALVLEQCGLLASTISICCMLTETSNPMYRRLDGPQALSSEAWKISPSLDFDLRIIPNDQGLIPDRNSMFSLLLPVLLFLPVCNCAVCWHRCWWWYIRWLLWKLNWKWRWWSYEVDHTPSCGTEIKNVCSLALTLPWNDYAVEIVTWTASLLCFVMCLHMFIDH